MACGSPRVVADYVLYHVSISRSALTVGKGLAQ